MTRRGVDCVHEATEDDCVDGVARVSLGEHVQSSECKTRDKRRVQCPNLVCGTRGCFDRILCLDVTKCQVSRDHVHRRHFALDDELTRFGYIGDTTDAREFYGKNVSIQRRLVESRDRRWRVRGEVLFELINFSVLGFDLL